ncbi:FMN-dependent NADH-azoreductase [Sphingomonas colocasiae]|uniref:FMN dependent NADH:quinone oxidoreductase n=1 Tax=Sphingomonas colocasiae TaxID=1848973 RepID=A0ABS7PYL1_9SPHN|nr:NAD(P)H-dependent oxidoreductase [Sphingomonas colocasiae]MBY8826278.1 NAD(P)H-dependent oxidoreductase [Sphingomonas colocasiae]
MKLLHIDSSVQGDASVSRTVSAAVVARLRTADPAIELRYRDLSADPLPHLTLDRLAGVESDAAIEEFLAADIVVIGVPMYNFGIPTQLKSWFDHILVAGRTFRYGADGGVGLAAGKRVIVALSRGGIYSGDGVASEHAERHVRAMLGFAGIADPEFVVAEGVALGTELREAAMAAALAQAAALDNAAIAMA